MLEQMMLMQLKNKNPQMYNQFMQMKQSGKSPEQVLNEMLQSGQVSQQDVQNAQNYIANNGGQNGNGPKKF